MSPFLFILMAKGLGRSIVALREDNSIRGLRGSNEGASHSHHQLVNDAMLLGYPLVQEAASFKTSLHQFGQASGLEVNPQKS